MTTLAEEAIAQDKTPAEVAKAAVKDAIADAPTDADKEALAQALFKEATGRFPQESKDRKTVYQWGLVLVGIIFIVTMAVVVILILKNKAVPDAAWAFATALGSGVVGGLFGYAKQ